MALQWHYILCEQNQQILCKRLLLLGKKVYNELSGNVSALPRRRRHERIGLVYV